MARAVLSSLGMQTQIDRTLQARHSRRVLCASLAVVLGLSACEGDAGLAAPSGVIRAEQQTSDGGATLPITVTPAQGFAGTQVLVKGSGFKHGGTIKVTVCGQNGTTQADMTMGAFSYVTNVPNSAAPPSCTVSATDNASTGTFPFIVPAPKLTLSSPSGPPGSLIVASASGFKPGYQVNVSGFCQTSGCYPDTSGACNIPLVASSVPGSYTLTATAQGGGQGGATASAPFSVTSATGTACSCVGKVCGAPDGCGGICSASTPSCLPTGSCTPCAACNGPSADGRSCVPLANGTSCSDGNACTRTDTCQSGTCVGASPVVCTTPDQCHTPGTCNRSNGACSAPTAVTYACMISATYSVLAVPPTGGPNGTPADLAEAHVAAGSLMQVVVSGVNLQPIPAVSFSGTPPILIPAANFSPSSTWTQLQFSVLLSSGFSTSTETYLYVRDLYSNKTSQERLFVAPIASSLAPTQIPAGGTDTLVHVNGAGWSEESNAYYAHPSAYIAGTRLAVSYVNWDGFDITVPAGMLGAAGTLPVDILATDWLGDVVHAATLTLTVSQPSLTLTPSAGGPLSSFIAKATHFPAGQQVVFSSQIQALPLTCTSDATGACQVTIQTTSAAPGGYPITARVSNSEDWRQPSYWATAPYQILAPWITTVTYTLPGSSEEKVYDGETSFDATQTVKFTVYGHGFMRPQADGRHATITLGGVELRNDYGSNTETVLHAEMSPGLHAGAGRLVFGVSDGTNLAVGPAINVRPHITGDFTPKNTAFGAGVTLQLPGAGLIDVCAGCTTPSTVLVNGQPAQLITASYGGVVAFAPAPAATDTSLAVEIVTGTTHTHSNVVTINITGSDPNDPCHSPFITGVPPYTTALDPVRPTPGCTRAQQWSLGVHPPQGTSAFLSDGIAPSDPLTNMDCYLLVQQAANDADSYALANSICDQYDWGDFCVALAKLKCAGIPAADAKSGVDDSDGAVLPKASPSLVHPDVPACAATDTCMTDCHGTGSHSDQMGRWSSWSGSGVTFQYCQYAYGLYNGPYTMLAYGLGRSDDHCASPGHYQYTTSSTICTSDPQKLSRGTCKTSSESVSPGHLGHLFDGSTCVLE